MLQLDRRRLAAAVLADHTHRPQLEPAQLPHQRRVGAVEADRRQLAMEHRHLQVRVVAEARLDVAAVGLQAARRRPPPLAAALAPQIAPHRLRIPAGVPGDRSHRPGARSERVNLHVVVLCEHPRGALPTRVAGIEHP